MKNQQYNLALIEHEVEHQVIHQRSSDGYVNATAICNATGKKIVDYLSSDFTKDFLNALAMSIKTPIDMIVQEITNGDSEQRGIWVHPQVAINLAQWCSPEFAVQVSQFVFDWMNGNNPAQKLIDHWQHYLARTSMLHNSVPDGYFSVFHEAAPMIVAMIQSGVIVNDKTVPDISVGQHWAKYWKANFSSQYLEPVKYAHHYPDMFPQSTSNPQMVKAYPDTAVSEFRQWMRIVYLPEKFPKYISSKQKSGQIAPETANKLIDAFATKQINKY